VLAGGEIAGVAGMFLSVPVIAAARIVWRRLQGPENGYSPSLAATTAVTVGSRRDS
jgi:predicted PurR-regulated permease PerM